MPRLLLQLAPRCEAGRLVIPKALEAICRQLLVMGGVLDILVSQVVLDGAGILAVVRQFKAGGMPEHMGMDGHPQLSCLTSAGYQLSKGGGGHWGLPFGDEHIRGLWVIPPKVAQRPKFGAAQGLGARQAVLAPARMQQSLMQVHLLAPQGHQVRHTQPVPIGQQDHGGIPVAMASQVFGGSHQPVDFGWRQVFSAASLGIGLFGGSS
jgi:hypothetical protein